jgi:hypothetical protein
MPILAAPGRGGCGEEMDRGRMMKAIGKILELASVVVMDELIWSLGDVIGW